MRQGIGALGVLLVGAAVASVVWIAEGIRTGIASLDRYDIRLRLAWAALRTFGPQVAIDLAIPRALMAIVNNESRGDPKNYLGDATLGGGPSIGPMQVYRSTAKDLKLWAPPPGATVEQERAAYALLAKDEALGIRWGVAVFASKLKLAGGNVTEAIRRYNGSGPLAEAYRDRAVTFLAQHGWNTSRTA